MLTPTQHAALARWYGQEQIVAEARRLFAEGAYDELENYLHRTALLPLGRLDDLPGYLQDDDGGPLFPTSFNPMADEEVWQNGIEVGWEVMAAKAGFTHDDVHRAIAAAQDDEFQVFLASVEQRKKERRQG